MASRGVLPCLRPAHHEPWRAWGEARVVNVRGVANGGKARRHNPADSWAARRAEQDLRAGDEDLRGGSAAGSSRAGRGAARASAGVSGAPAGREPPPRRRGKAPGRRFRAERAEETVPRRSTGRRGSGGSPSEFPCSRRDVSGEPRRPAASTPRRRFAGEEKSRFDERASTRSRAFCAPAAPEVEKHLRARMNPPSHPCRRTFRAGGRRPRDHLEGTTSRFWAPTPPGTSSDGQVQFGARTTRP